MGDTLKEWYYMTGDRRGTSVERGPFTTSQMRDLLKKGEINDMTRVRYGTKSLWRPVSDVPLFAKTALEVESRRTRSRLVRRYGTGILIVGAAVCLIAIYGRVRLPLTPSSPGTSVAPSAPSPHTRPTEPRPVQETLSKGAIVSLTNNARVLNGLPPLRGNQLLDAIAESRAKDMIEKQYFAHVSPTGQQASDVAQGVGYRYKIIAENIASGMFYTNQKVIDGWMQSPGHRKNILSREVEEVGAAIVPGVMNGQKTYVAVQIFGLPSLPVPQQTCVPPSQNLLGEIELKKAELAGLNEQLERLQQELEADRSSIERDREPARSEPGKGLDLNMRIKAFNEKYAWYNKVLAEAGAKSSVLQSMVNEYNRMVQSYKDCRTSLFFSPLDRDNDVA
jgi:uncharacterized protein YkwD